MSTRSHRKGVGSEIYSGAASFGRFWAMFGAIVATIIGIVLIIVGIMTLVRKPDNRIKASAQVMKAICDAWTDSQGNRKYNCTLTLKYVVNGKPYIKNISTKGDKMYTTGQNVDVYYKENNPGDVEVDKSMPKWAGWLFILGGFLVAGIAWLWVWLTRRYKFAAAAAGVGGGLEMVRGVL